MGNHSPLADWQNFYVLVGSSAGALTGLQFVVIALMTQARATTTMREIRAFGTPTVIHFCAALILSALSAAPWPALLDYAGCLIVCGAAGMLYSGSVVWHARKSAYNPDLEDWVWYTGFPLLAYAVLLASAVLLWIGVTASLFAVAADAVFFLLLGIHNSWDTVTYIAVRHARTSNEQ